jgi:hypothetical protein
MLPREYARRRWQARLAYEADLGVNPFKFGMIGSTDSHTALSTARRGQLLRQGAVEPEPTADPIRFEEAITGRIHAGRPGIDDQIHADAPRLRPRRRLGAREHARGDLGRLKRKEVYATTGTRIRVRVFAGWDFEEDDLTAPTSRATAMRNGVPMGGDLAGPRGRRADAADPRAARSRRRQSRPRPGREGLGRRRGRDPGAHLRRRLVGRARDPDDRQPTARSATR